MDVAFGKLTEDLTGTLERTKTALIDDEQDDADDATHYALLVVLKRIDTLLAQHNVRTKRLYRTRLCNTRTRVRAQDDAIHCKHPAHEQRRSSTIIIS